MGVGQRVIRGAAHVGGVIVVRDSRRVRAALEPVYAAMGVDWDPETTGSVEDELGVATREAVAATVLAELRSRFAIEDSDRYPVEAPFARAAELEARFAIEATTSRAAAPIATPNSKIAIEPA
jgi:hypothetical protein